MSKKKDQTDTGDKVRWLLANTDFWVGKPEIPRETHLIMAYEMKTFGLYSEATKLDDIAKGLPSLIDRAKKYSCGRELVKPYAYQK